MASPEELHGNESGRFKTHRQMLRDSAELDECLPNQFQFNADLDTDSERQENDVAYARLRMNRKRGS